MAPSARLKQIDSDTVKFIAAGEKICDVESVVRELVENSIDAGATSIEVRLGRSGLDIIEVEDNGAGIEPENFKMIGQRYHTSKISDFKTLQEDLITFGFRGEALSCLCNVANVTILTKSRDTPTGSKLIFDKTGKLSKTDLCARTIGTTVVVKNLFHSLPVRRRELETEAACRRQYDKVSKLLWEMCFARPDIRYTLCKRTTTRKDLDFSIGKTTLQSCIISTYSIKTMENLVELKDEATEASPSMIDLTDGEAKSSIKRKDTEDPAVANKFFKRSCKSKFYKEKPRYSIKGYISKVKFGRNSPDAQFFYVNKKPCSMPRVAHEINTLYKSFSSGQYPFLCLFVNVQPWAADFNVPKKREVILQEENDPGVSKSCSSVQIPFKLKSKLEPTESAAVSNCQPDLIVTSGSGLAAQVSAETATPGSPSHRISSIQSPRESHSDSDAVLMSSSRLPGDVLVSSPSSTKSLARLRDTLPHPNLDRKLSGDYGDTSKATAAPRSPPAESLSDSEEPCDFSQKITYCSDDLIKVDIDCHYDLKKALDRERGQRKKVSDSREFNYSIHPKFNSVAEEELKLNLNKSSFEKMEVLGQFNRGFIVTRLHKHIFIIDQHATDERANFEKELEHPALEHQLMIHPKPLYLNSIQENVVQNNREIFKAKGFDFIYNNEAVPGLRVLLKSTLICRDASRDEYLDREDVEELIDVVTNSPNSVQNYTLRKVKAIAASRACRESVMIGDPLEWSAMDRIVARMANLKNPWVCAHNRPTIRHLMDTDWMG